LKLTFTGAALSQNVYHKEQIEALNQLPTFCKSPLLWQHDSVFQIVMNIGNKNWSYVSNWE